MEKYRDSDAFIIFNNTIKNRLNSDTILVRPNFLSWHVFITSVSRRFDDFSFNLIVFFSEYKKNIMNHWSERTLFYLLKIVVYKL